MAAAAARRPVVAAVALALALLALACLLPGAGLAWEHPDGNLLIFRSYGDLITTGAVPYRDVRIEYPPGALPAIALPALGPLSYGTSFKVLAALLAAATIPLVAFLLARLGRPPRAVVAGTAFVPVALFAFGPIGLQRFDLLPAALCVVALWLLLADRPRWAFAVIGVATLVKIYPLVLAPLAFLWVLRRQGRREALVGAAVLAAVGAAVLVPFAAIDHVGLYLSFAQQANRHLQLETLGSSALLVAHLAGGYDPRVVFDAGADTLAGRLPDAVAKTHSWLQALGLLALYAGFARIRRPTGEQLVAAATAAVAVFAVLGKVLSPQFLLWLVPLVPLLAGRRPLVAAALLVPALALAHAIYPPLYEDLKALHAGPIALLALRNALLVALLASLMAPTLRAARPPGRPARARGRSRPTTPPAPRGATSARPRA